MKPHRSSHGNIPLKGEQSAKERQTDRILVYRFVLSGFQEHSQITENEPEDRIVSQRPIISFDLPALISKTPKRIFPYPSVKVKFDLFPMFASTFN